MSFHLPVQWWEHVTGEAAHLVDEVLDGIEGSHDDWEGEP